MSASLVGSEMCIRDSLEALQRLREGSAEALWSLCDRGSSVGALRGLVAVSYTHLTLPTICSV
eukprot:3673196-Alexandrium_andersonii.AAC.1